MNIIIEDDINFYEQLNNLDSDDEDVDFCLLTKMPLDKNKITLPCKHSFNFIPLYREVCIQKTHSPSHLDMDKVRMDQIKCPYCRQKFNFLLPHVRINKDVTYIYGVNKPEQLCMPFHKCRYVFNSGKQKNVQCDKTGYYDQSECYCPSHHTIMSKRNSSLTKSKIIKNQTSVCKCKATLKAGKRIGEECGLNILTEGAVYCKRHVHQLISM